MKTNRKSNKSNPSNKIQKGNAVMKNQTKKVTSNASSKYEATLKSLLKQRETIVNSIIKVKATLKKALKNGNQVAVKHQRKLLSNAVSNKKELVAALAETKQLLKKERQELRAEAKEQREAQKQERLIARQKAQQEKSAAKALRAAQKQSRKDAILAKKQWAKVRNVKLTAAQLKKAIALAAKSIGSKPFNPTETRMAKKLAQKLASYPTKTLPRRVRKFQMQLLVAQAVVAQVKELKHWK